jgi:GxxExxY protein
MGRFVYVRGVFVNEKIITCAVLLISGMTENEISFQIRGAIFKIYNALGPGLLESAYTAVLSYELAKRGLRVSREVPVPLIYDEVHMDVGYRMDLKVEDKVLIEVKSVEKLTEAHHKFVITYLRLANLKLGILVNFSTSDIAGSIYRKVNSL